MTASRAGALAGRHLALLFALGAIWGTSFPFISIALDPASPRFSPLLFAALRFDVAGVALAAFVLWRARAASGWGARLRALAPSSRAQAVAIVTAATLNIATYHALLFVGQPRTNAAIAAIIVGLNPVMTTVFARSLLRDERVGAWGVVGLLLGLAGVAILALSRGGNLLDAQGVGEFLVVGAILAFALGSTLVRRTRHGLDPFAFTAWQMLAGAVLLHVGAFAFEGGGFARWDATGLVALAYLALAASAAGFVIYFTLLDHAGPIRANLVSYVAPVFSTLIVTVAPLLGAPIPGAPFRWAALVAFALIAVGFGLVARPAPPRAGAEGAPAMEG